MWHGKYTTAKADASVAHIVGHIDEEVSAHEISQQRKQGMETALDDLEDKEQAKLLNQLLESRSQPVRTLTCDASLL